MTSFKMLASLGMLLTICALTVPWGIPTGRRAREERARSNLLLGLVGLAVLGLASCFGSPEPYRAGLFVFDRLAFVSLGVLASIAFAVHRFSLTYLEGDPNHRRFLLTMGSTVGATMLFVVADHLVLVGALWIAMSFGMHTLLKHFRSRAAARRAANKKFWFSRVGDACFWSAVVLLASSGTSLRPSEWNVASFAGGSFGAVGLLLVASALLKSAQFPFHTWLPETMEAPTPVSALMHAGVVNAGGLLLLRVTPLLAAAPRALDFALFVGGVTAAIGCVVWWTQTDVKKSLAWSTIAQMGFLMVEIGLGLYHAALLHLLGHALYKAHSFLRSGTLPRSETRSRKGAAPAREAIVASVVPAVVATLLVASFGYLGARLAVVNWESEAVVAILWGVVSLEAARRSAPGVGARTAVVVAGFLTLALFQAASHSLLSHWFTSAPSLHARGLVSFDVAVSVVSLLGFASAWLVVPRRLREGDFGATFHVHALNGFYFGTYAALVHAKLKNLLSPEGNHS